MNRTLGLDLGSNSLGWAILDDVTCDVIDKGVVVFPEGLNDDAKTSLDTLAAERRKHRMERRMKFRRRLRKQMLLKALARLRLCPLSEAEAEAWQKTGAYPIGNRAFLDWLKSTDASNPYADRNAAAEGRVAPFTLGRALYHICQRRGFKSSRKEEAAQYDDEGNPKKDADKELGKVKGGIRDLDAEIRAAGCKTLGQYFYRIIEAEREKPAKSRVRKRYTGRKEHYEVEFNAIMDAQGYAKGDQARKELYNAIFAQRPLRSQAHLVGRCPLETHNPRIQVGHPAFEEFRMLSFVNNLVLEDAAGRTRDDDGERLYPLSPDDLRLIAAETSKVLKPTFKTVLRLFKKDPRFAEQGLRFHYYREDDAVPGCPIRLHIKKGFGDVAYDEQKVFDALTFYNDRDLLAGWFRKHYPALDDKAVAALTGIYPSEGNGQYSLKAINLMLPFLRRGLDPALARFCAKLPQVVPDFAARADTIIAHLEELARAARRDKAAHARLAPQIRKTTPKPLGLDERRHDYLTNELGVSEEDYASLYLRGDETYAPQTTCKRLNPATARFEETPLACPRLPCVRLGMIRNPTVQRAMTTLRRLVNYLGDHGKIDSDDTIRIELARSVNDFATRRAWMLWQEKRRKAREEAAAQIAAHGIAATEDAIDRYVLAKEQNWTCLYTGRNIDIDDLLSGNAFDIEHTVPRSLSGDDSMANKTICEAAYNRQVKQGRVPKDCPNWDEIATRLRPWQDDLAALEKTLQRQMRAARTSSDPAAKCNARVKALVTRFERDYWRDKLRRFEAELDRLTAREGELGGFKRRQLVDTGIMCSHAVDLIRCVYPRTFAVNGAATAFARKAWGIQADGTKDRSEHTHHAKDAMVIAALTPSRFTAICTALKDDAREERRACDVCPKPCDDFAEKVRRAADEILVKHVTPQKTLRQSSKRNVLAKSHRQKDDPSKIVSKVLSRGDTVRGKLHEATYYGKIKHPETQVLMTVVRTNLAGCKISDIKKDVPNIVDPVIRDIVAQGIGALEAKGETSVPATGFSMPSGVPIKRVRIQIVGARQNPAAVKAHVFPSKNDYKGFLYAPTAGKGNFRMAIYKNPDNGKLTFATDNLLDWAKRHKEADYVAPENRPGFVGYVMPGTLALAHAEGEDASSLPVSILRKRLYYVRTLPTEKDKHCEIQYHLAAGMKKDLGGKNDSGDKGLNLERPQALFRFSSPRKFLSSMLFEGIHFKMMIDGTIRFL